jgi:Redoxin
VINWRRHVSQIFKFVRLSDPVLPSGQNEYGDVMAYKFSSDRRFAVSRRQFLIGAGAMGVSGLTGCDGPSRDLSALALPPLAGLTRGGRAVGGMQNGELKQGITVLVAWSSGCGYCRLNHEFLLTTRGHPEFVIAGVVSNDDESDARNYLQKYGNPYNFVAFDDDMQLGRLTGYTAVPTTYLVDATAMVRKVFVGAFDQERLDEEFMPALRQLV